MKRKTIELGKTCIVVSLPVKWVRDNKIKKGEELEIEEKEGDLIIHPKETEKPKKKIEIDVSNTSERLNRAEINRAYSTGYDEINVKFRTKKEQDIIKETIDNLLLGFDITEKQKNSLKIEAVTEPSTEKQEVLLRRMFLLTIETFEQLINDLETNNFSNFKTILENSRKVLRYHNFCQRNISRKAISTEKAIFHSPFYLFLSLIVNKLYQMYKYMERGEKINTKEIIELSNQAKEYYQKTYSGYFSKDLEILRKTDEGLSNFRYHVLQDKIEQSKGVESVFLHHLAEIAWLTQMMENAMLPILLSE